MLNTVQQYGMIYQFAYNQLLIRSFDTFICYYALMSAGKRNTEQKPQMQIVYIMRGEYNIKDIVNEWYGEKKNINEMVHKRET